MCETTKCCPACEEIKRQKQMILVQLQTSGLSLEQAEKVYSQKR